RFQDDWLAFVAQRVAGIYALQPHARADVARIDFFNLFALVGGDLEQAADALAGALSGVVDIAAGLEDAGVHTNVGNVADERIGHDLERQSGKWSIVRSTAQDDFVVFRVHAFERR